MWPHGSLKEPAGQPQRSACPVKESSLLVEGDNTLMLPKGRVSFAEEVNPETGLAESVFQTDMF